MAKRKGSNRPLKSHEGGAQASDEQKRVRFPSPAEMSVLDSILVAGAFPTPEVARWRKIRQLANRMKYEEREGKRHEAWDTAFVGDPKDAPAGHVHEIDPLTYDEFTAMIQPPLGEYWSTFGKQWDIGPERETDEADWEPVQRHQSIDSQWNAIRASNAVNLSPD